MVPSTTSFRIIQEWKDEIQTHLHPNDQKAFLIMAQKHALLPSKRKPSLQSKNKKGSIDAVTAIDTTKVQVFANSEQFPTGAMYDWETRIRQVQQQSASSTTTTNIEEWKKYVPSLSQKQPKTNPNRAIIIHNNWIEGKVPKLQRFIQSQLWYVQNITTTSV
jgi:hypothetical protein